jgi:membrane protein implicated in regulation of membrane protease activity
LEIVMDALLLWIGAASLLGVAEMFTMGLFLAPFALGAAIAGLLAWIGIGFSASLAVFAVVSMLLLLAVRPLLLSRRTAPVAIRTGTAALVGSRALVLERIANHHPGAVRIGGEVWTARAYGEDEVIEAGHVVDVIEIQGATALVTE